MSYGQSVKQRSLASGASEGACAAKELSLRKSTSLPDIGQSEARDEDMSPRKATQIDEQYSRLLSRLTELTEVVSILEKKTEPIVRPDPCVVGGTEKEKECAPSAPLAAALKECNGRLQNLISRIRSVNNRNEL